MLLKQIEKPDIKKLLESLLPSLELPCNKCGKRMKAKPHLLWGDCDFDPEKGGWDVRIIADDYHCDAGRFFNFHHSNPGEWFCAYVDGRWEWHQPMRID